MAPPFLYQSDAVTAALAVPAAQRKEIATRVATTEGALAASYTAAVWLPYIAYINYRPNANGMARWFNKRLNTSAKTALTTMPILFAFVIVSEQVTSRLANPDAFARELADGRLSTLPLYQRTANFVYDHPFRVLITLGLPTVTWVYIAKGGDSSLSISQRIMHTRVIGQFSVLAILAATMGFYDYMGRRGRFLELWEKEENQRFDEAVKAEAAEILAHPPHHNLYQHVPQHHNVPHHVPARNVAPPAKSE